MNKPKTRNGNIVVQEIENEILIYDLKTNKAFCLNETSALIYQLCNGERSVAEIADTISIKLKTIVSENLIWLALDNFKKENLLEENKQFEIDFDGLSRRQVIKKVGLASIIALPIVASVIAPSAAMAASGILLGGVCPPACAAGLQCRSLTVGSGSRCCVPGAPFSQTFPPGVPACLTNCAADTPAICCSGSGTTAPADPFCGMFGLQTCTCNPFP